MGSFKLWQEAVATVDSTRRAAALHHWLLPRRAGVGALDLVLRRALKTQAWGTAFAALGLVAPSLRRLDVVVEAAHTLDTGGWLCCCTRLTWLCLETCGTLRLSSDLVRLTSLREMRLALPARRPGTNRGVQPAWGRLQDPPLGSFPPGLTSLSMLFMYMDAVPSALAGAASSLQRLELYCCRSLQAEGEQAVDDTPAAGVLSALTALTTLALENFGSLENTLPAEVTALQQLRALSWCCGGELGVPLAEVRGLLGRLSSLSMLWLGRHEADVVPCLPPGQLRLLHLEGEPHVEAHVPLLGGLQSLALPIPSFIKDSGALAGLPQLRHLLLLLHWRELDAGEEAGLGPALLELRRLPRLEELGLDEDVDGVSVVPASCSALEALLAMRPALQITQHDHSSNICDHPGCHWSI